MLEGELKPPLLQSNSGQTRHRSHRKAHGCHRRQRRTFCINRVYRAETSLRRIPTAMTGRKAHIPRLYLGSNKASVQYSLSWKMPSGVSKLPPSPINLVCQCHSAGKTTSRIRRSSYWVLCYLQSDFHSCISVCYQLGETRRGSNELLILLSPPLLLCILIEFLPFSFSA